jgi:hypothetical protein
MKSGAGTDQAVVCYKMAAIVRTIIPLFSIIYGPTNERAEKLTLLKGTAFRPYIMLSNNSGFSR